MQQNAAELAQAADGAVQQGSDDWFRGRTAGQFIQIALDGDSSTLLFHGSASAAEIDIT